MEITRNILRNILNMRNMSKNIKILANNTKNMQISYDLIEIINKYYEYEPYGIIHINGKSLNDIL